MKKIQEVISRAVSVSQSIGSDTTIIGTIEKIVAEIVRCLGSGGKVLLCGNGGSAADAQHIACELSGRFYKNRKALHAEALHVNSSYLTAVANDFGYHHVFARAVEAKGKPGDILIALSTSGNSKNIIKAIEYANESQLITIGLTGITNSSMDGICKHIIKVPTDDTPRIQEAHILIGHIICELIEEELF
jgi:D-sedoheptulose 7-phosphate isomerase